eukprot:12154999-Alexandrium_andersonii.AAC.1
MSASLVGSEMCIRDSRSTTLRFLPLRVNPELRPGTRGVARKQKAYSSSCLLYTSDAADDM